MPLFLQIDADVIDCIDQKSPTPGPGTTGIDDDEALTVYMPTNEDRIAARRFCVQHLDPSSKGPFLEKLKKRMGIGESDDDRGLLF